MSIPFHHFLPPPISSLHWSGHLRGGGKKHRAGKEWCGEPEGESHRQVADSAAVSAWDVQKRTSFTSSVEKEEACSMRGGHVFRHIADFQVVDETPEKEKQT